MTVASGAQKMTLDSLRVECKKGPLLGCGIRGAIGKKIAGYKWSDGISRENRNLKKRRERIGNKLGFYICFLNGGVSNVCFSNIFYFG